MVDFKDMKSRLGDIEYIVSELEGDLDELWDAYLTVLDEKEELLQKINELEAENEITK